MPLFLSGFADQMAQVIARFVQKLPRNFYVLEVIVVSAHDLLAVKPANVGTGVAENDRRMSGNDQLCVPALNPFMQ